MVSLSKYLFISLLFVVVLHTSALSQKLELQNIEQINLVTDRILYISGEQIWYSATYSIPNNNSLNLSKVLYVELFDNEKQLISSQKVAINNDVITGQITIPEHAATGYYILRAYTRYQENFPAWQFSSVILSVVNPTTPLPTLPLQSENNQSIIALMPNKNIAFKINNRFRNNVDSVKLLVNQLNVSAKGLYFSNGLGSFSYKALPNDTISLLIKLNSGDSIISKPYFVGTYTKKLSADYFSDKLRILFKSDAITDISVLPDDTINLNFSEIDSTEYPLTVSLTIKGTHNTNLQLLPNYLINNPLYINNCLSSLALSDDKLIDQIRIAIALKQETLFSIINKDNYTINRIIPELSGLTIQGKVINSQTKKPVNNELVYASVLGDEPQFHAATTMQDGDFIIPLNFCNNLQDIFIATNNTDNIELDIQIDDGFCPTPPNWVSTPFFMDTSYRELITQMYMNYQIANVFNIKQKETAKTSTNNKAIFGDNLTQIKLSNFIQMSTTPEVFNELVPNVRVRKKDGNYKLIVFDDDLNIKYENPLVLIDNMPYSNINKLMGLQPTEIEQIDIINHEYRYGNNLFRGIIMITTNTGNFANLPLSQDGVFVEYQTVEPTVNFIPFNSSQNTSGKPNFANTAYWKSFNYDDKNMQIQIIAPSNNTEYELIITSMANKTTVTERK